MRDRQHCPPDDAREPVAAPPKPSDSRSSGDLEDEIKRLRDALTLVLFTAPFDSKVYRLAQDALARR